MYQKRAMIAKPRLPRPAFHYVHPQSFLRHGCVFICTTHVYCRNKVTKKPQKIQRGEIQKFGQPAAFVLRVYKKFAKLQSVAYKEKTVVY